MKINQIMTTVALAIIFVVALVAARNLIEGGYSVPAKNADGNQQPQERPELQNGVQVVKLSYIDYLYKLEPPVMIKGVPVRIEVDTDTVVGCMQYVTIPGFNVKKFVSKSDNIIEFTPDRAGTFTIVCSMGMGKNTFKVIEN